MPNRTKASARGSASLRGLVDPFLVYDTFDADPSNEDLFSAHSPSSDFVGKGWSEEGSGETWTVNAANDNLEIPAAISGSSIAVIDIGTLFADVRFRIYLPNAGNWHTVFAIGGDSAGVNAGFNCVFWNTNTSRIQRLAASIAPGNFSYHDNAWHTMRFTVERNGVITWYIDGSLFLQATGQNLSGLDTYFQFHRGQDGVATYRLDDLRIEAL